MTASRKCSARRADGQPCRAWARQGSLPPRCAWHKQDMGYDRPIPTVTDQQVVAGVRQQGFYEGRYSMEEIADLLNADTSTGLSDEVSAARVAVRRMLEHLEEELTPHEYAHLAQAIFTGTNSIVRLLRAQNELAGHSHDGFHRIINLALDEMSKSLKSNL